MVTNGCHDDIVREENPFALEWPEVLAIAAGYALVVLLIVMLY